MINLMRKLLASGATLAGFLSLAPQAFAAVTNIELSAPPQALPSNTNIGGIPQFIVTLLFVIAIIISVVFLIYGGIKWILSGGDSKQVEGARNHIVAAIVGLIIVVGAFVILNVVFTIVTGNSFNFSNLCIPSLANTKCT